MLYNLTLALLESMRTRVSLDASSPSFPALHVEGHRSGAPPLLADTMLADELASGLIAQVSAHQAAD